MLVNLADLKLLKCVYFFFFLANNSRASQCSESVLFCVGMKCTIHTSRNFKHKQRLFTLSFHAKTLGIFTVWHFGISVSRMQAMSPLHKMRDVQSLKSCPLVGVNDFDPIWKT